MTYGYVRVSTKGQSELWQVLALEDLGISIKQTYTDKQGGKDFDRPQYKKLLRKLKSGDILAFAAAIEIDPRQVPAHQGAADVYLALGETDKAVELLEQGVLATESAELQTQLDTISVPTPEPTPSLTPELTPEPTPSPAPPRSSGNLNADSLTVTVHNSHSATITLSGLLLLLVWLKPYLEFLRATHPSCRIDSNTKSTANSCVNSKKKDLRRGMHKTTIKTNPF